MRIILSITIIALFKKTSSPLNSLSLLLYLLVIFFILIVPTYAQQIHARSFYSYTLQSNWSYSVYIPQILANEQERRYPVIFMMHGMYNNDRTFNMRGFSALLNQLIHNNIIEPVIVVFPNGFRQSWWINSEAFGPIEDAFFNDLVPHINTNYPILLEPEQRVLAGISMGGFGALRYAFHPSNQFAHLLLFSPALFFPTPDQERQHPQAFTPNWQYRNVIRNIMRYNAFAIEQSPNEFNAARYLLHSYPSMHQENPSRLASLNIFLFYGEQDPVTDSGTRFFRDFLERHAIAFHHYATAIGTHNWALWRNDMTRALISLFAVGSSSE